MDFNSSNGNMNRMEWGVLRLGAQELLMELPAPQQVIHSSASSYGLRLVPGGGRTGRLMFPPYLSSLMILIIRPGKNIFFFVHFFEKARLA